MRTGPPGGIVGASVQERQNLADRLKAFIERSGKTQRQIADELGVDESYVSKLASGSVNWTASRKFFVPLIRSLGIRPDEVAALRPDVVIEFAAPSVPIHTIATGNDLTALDSGAYIMKNLHALAQASRPVSEMEPLEHGSPIPVERARLRSGTVLFEVAGDSMRTGETSGILPGDVVFVDTSDREAVAGRVYVIALEGEGVCIKRVRSLAGALWLFSDNPDQANYPPFQAEEARIVGHAYYRQPRGESLL